MTYTIPAMKANVNCRIGSLESLGEIVERYQIVNCRIGSLEKWGMAFPLLP